MRIFLTFTMLLFSFQPLLAIGAKNSNPIVIMKTTQGDIHLELFEKSAPKTVANFIGLAEGTKEYRDIKTDKKMKGNFYDGVIFHRVIKGFMIQGGDPRGNGTGGPGYKFEDEINATDLGLGKLKAVQENGALHRYQPVRTQQDYQRFILMPLYKAMGINSPKELETRKSEVLQKIKEITIKNVYENQGYVYSSNFKSYHLKKGVIAMANSGPNTNGSQFFINLADTPHLTGKHTVFGKVVKGMEVVEKVGDIKVGQGSKPIQDIKIISVRLKK